MQASARRVFLLAMLAALVLGCLEFAASRRALAVSGSAEAAPVILIDPGHGGEDGGAVSADGVAESGINLEISLRLRDLLQLCGIRTQMIRQTDTAVYSPGCSTISQKKVSDLKNRVQTVNALDGAWLISIHQNFFEQSRYSGAQVFYAKTDGSRALAEAVQGSLRAVQPENRRECKRSQSVYLMENVHCTAVLVECGFLSNPQEAALLQTKEHQQKLAGAVCAAILSSIQERGTDDEV